MRRTKEEAAATRRQVMESALKVFSQKGYSATTLDDIAREAGVTRGAIYWHFSSKADLYTTLVAEMSARVSPIMEQVISDGGSVPEVLRRLLVRILSYMEEDEEFCAVQELVLFKTDVTPELEEGMRNKRAGTRMIVDYIAGLIQNGIDSSEIRPDVNPHDAALGMIAYQNGIAALWLLDRSLFSIKDRAEPMVDILVRGISS